MLEIKTGKKEYYDEEAQAFVSLYEGPVFQLEHSLLSLSKWEAKYKKPFLSGKDDKSQEELLDYFKMMVVEGNPDDLIKNLTSENLIEIGKYISEDKQTATWFSDNDADNAPSREVITAEILYYVLFSNRIDKECENWNLNRLLTLFRIFSEKAKENDPSNKKKMSQREIMNRNRALNEARKKKFKTKG